MLEKLKERLNLQENYLSMGIGLIVVLIVAGVIFNASTKRTEEESISEGEATSSAEMTADEEKESGNEELPAVYTVKKGDRLWDIAEKYYNSGYNWVDIAEENKLGNPNLIKAEEALVIPKVEPKTKTLEKGPAEKKQLTSYTVKKGDSLWKIAVEQYGDGYSWTKIAQANNLKNPHYIEVNDKFVLPDLN